MNRKFPLPHAALIGVALCIAGCNQPAGQKSKNSAKLDSLQVERTYHLLGNPDNPNCNLTLNFVYPVDYKNKAILPDVQKQFISSYFGEKYEQLTPQEAIQQYADDYVENYKELEEIFSKDLAENELQGAWYSYYEMSSDVILYNENGLLSYSVSFENYTGGAHGSHSFTNFTIDLENGRHITEEDLFVDGYETELAELLVEEIARKNELDNKKDLEDIGYFSIDEIYPNDNFYIDATGITYTFNEYEIAAYALGATEVHLGFEQIKPLMKEDNPISGRIDF